MDRFQNYNWLTREEKDLLEQRDNEIEGARLRISKLMQKRQVLRMRANRRKHRLSHERIVAE